MRVWNFRRLHHVHEAAIWAEQIPREPVSAFLVAFLRHPLNYRRSAISAPLTFASDFAVAHIAQDSPAFFGLERSPRKRISPYPGTDITLSSRWISGLSFDCIPHVPFLAYDMITPYSKGKLTCATFRPVVQSEGIPTLQRPRLGRPYLAVFL